MSDVTLIVPSVLAKLNTRLDPEHLAFHLNVN